MRQELKNVNKEKIFLELVWFSVELFASGWIFILLIKVGNCKNANQEW